MNEVLRYMHNHQGTVLIIAGVLLTFLLDQAHPPPPEFLLIVLSLTCKGLLSGASVVIGKWAMEWIGGKWSAYQENKRKALSLKQ